MSYTYIPALQRNEYFAVTGAQPGGTLELFTCLSVPPSGGGWQRGGAIPVPEGMG